MTSPLVPLARPTICSATVLEQVKVSYSPQSPGASRRTSIVHFQPSGCAYQVSFVCRGDHLCERAPSGHCPVGDRNLGVEQFAGLSLHHVWCGRRSSSVAVPVRTPSTKQRHPKQGKSGRLSVRESGRRPALSLAERSDGHAHEEVLVNNWMLPSRQNRLVPHTVSPNVRVQVARDNACKPWVQVRSERYRSPALLNGAKSRSKAFGTEPGRQRQGSTRVMGQNGSGVVELLSIRVTRRDKFSQHSSPVAAPVHTTTARTLS